MTYPYLPVVQTITSYYALMSSPPRQLYPGKNAPTPNSWKASSINNPAVAVCPQNFINLRNRFHDIPLSDEGWYRRIDDTKPLKLSDLNFSSTDPSNNAKARGWIRYTYLGDLNEGVEIIYYEHANAKFEEYYKKHISNVNKNEKFNFDHLFNAVSDAFPKPNTIKNTQR